MQVKANELRIGNLLKYTNYEKLKEDRRGKVFEVIPDDIQFLTEVDSCDYIEPIPLTEEWLVRLGLEYEYDTMESFKGKKYAKETDEQKHYCIFRNAEEISYFVFNFSSYMAYSHRIKTVKYVHELQNIFHAITGEELTIKP